MIDSSSEGLLPKIVIDGYYYKSGSTNYGFEPYAEVIATELGRYLGLNIIKTELVNGMSVTKILPYDIYNLGKILRVYYGDRLEFTDKFTLLEKIYDLGLDLNEMFDILVFDALIGNNDRHLNNFHITYSSEGSAIWSTHLDFGSLLFLPDEECKKSKPFEPTHIEQLSLIKSYEYYPFFLFSYQESDLVNFVRNIKYSNHKAIETVQNGYRLIEQVFNC